MLEIIELINMKKQVELADEKLNKIKYEGKKQKHIYKIDIEKLERLSDRKMMSKD